MLRIPALPAEALVFAELRTPTGLARALAFAVRAKAAAAALSAENTPPLMHANTRHTRLGLCTCFLRFLIL